MKSFRLFVFSMDVWDMRSLNVVTGFIVEKRVSGEIGFVSSLCQRCQEGMTHEEEGVEGVVEGMDEKGEEVMELRMLMMTWKHIRGMMKILLILRVQEEWRCKSLSWSTKTKRKRRLVHCKNRRRKGQGGVKVGTIAMLQKNIIRSALSFEESDRAQ